MDPSGDGNWSSRAAAIEEDIFLRVPTDMCPCTTLHKTKLTLRKSGRRRGYAQRALDPRMSSHDVIHCLVQLIDGN